MMWGEIDLRVRTYARVCAYQYTADSLRGAGLLTVCSPVQRDLSFVVWNADVGVMFDEEANVFWPVIKR